jgi:hypothetical protein
MVEKDEEARIARHVVSAGIGATFDIPQVSCDTVKVSTPEPANDRETLDRVLHARLKCHGDVLQL